MTYSKTDLFENELQRIAEIAKVLSHPARLAILEYLSNKATCISGDISNELPLSRTTVSQHLQELKKANLIQGTIEGVKINYCLNPETFNELKKLLNGFLDKITESHATCC